MDERTVRLNVGGQSFEVARSTLCAHPGYLANLLDCDGSIFIDRDPAHFPSVLAWLRDGQGMALPESDAARRVHIAFFPYGNSNLAKNLLSLEGSSRLYQADSASKY